MNLVIVRDGSNQRRHNWLSHSRMRRETCWQEEKHRMKHSEGTRKDRNDNQNCSGSHSTIALPEYCCSEKMVLYLYIECNSFLQNRLVSIIVKI